MTSDEFIVKANKIHQNKYNYSKSNYINSYTKICIICSEHGEFYQLPYKHLQGQGCPKCGIIKSNTKRSKTTYDFIKASAIIHSNKYNYSKTKYKNNYTKVIINCPQHGEFRQKPIDHLSGCGCPKCANDLKKSNTIEFIEKSKQIHENKFDYSKVEYINNHTKVCIICPKHGEFYQKPSNHLLGKGCPICKESKLEKEVKTFLKENNIQYKTQKTFDWLRHKLPLFLDYYLTDYKIGVECQGEQHFKKCFNDETKFIDNIKRDEIKFNLCNDHNIKIIYYTNRRFFNKEISSIYNDNNVIFNIEDIKLK